MSRIRINGTTLPVRQRIRYEYDPTRGAVIKIPWVSAGNNLAGLAALYQRERISFDWEPNVQRSTLVASASGPQVGLADVATDNWQVLGNEIQRDILGSPTAHYLESLAPGTLAHIARDVENYESNPQKPFEKPPLTGTAAFLRTMLIHKHTSYGTSQYVLKHTTNIANNNQATNVADVNVFRIYTTAQLLDEVGNKNFWSFPLPKRLRTKLSSIPSPTPQDGFLWGWLKKPSSEVTQAQNRVEINTEYWQELWPVPIYGLAE